LTGKKNRRETSRKIPPKSFTWQTHWFCAGNVRLSNMNLQVIRHLDPASVGASKSLDRFGIKILTIVCILLFLRAGGADATELKVKSTAGDCQIEATLARYPLVIGDNHIEIEIRDESGRSITDASVLVSYYMPPMPRMVPMNYKTEARMKKNAYEAKLDIIMAGPWYIKIIITHNGQISTTKFNFDAQ
jgi:hypothetical protein